MKKKNRKILYGAVLVFFVCLLFLAPPVMISKGGITLGCYDEDFDNPYAHLGREEQNFVNRNIHSTGDFEHFYFLNFRFWEKLEIHQAEYVGAPKEAEVRRILPFLYSASQNLKTSYHNAFGVQCAGKGWYFDYYVNIS